jgi:hypothetical protein
MLPTKVTPSVKSLICKIQKAAKEIIPCLKGKQDDCSDLEILNVPDIQGLFDEFSIKEMQLETGWNFEEEYIWDRLHKLGIYCDEGSYELLLSNDCTEGEARRIFCENGQPNLPPVRFKRLWSILKESSLSDLNFTVVTHDHQSDETIVHAATKEVRGMPVVEEYKIAMETLIKANRPIGQWSDEELLKAYNPDCDPIIIEVLDRKAHERAFVIFTDEANGVIDIEASMSLLKQARKGKTPVHYPVKNVLKRVYRSGHFPSRSMYHCPFHPDVILVNGYCDECQREWNVTNYEEMQFARIIYELGDAPTDRAYIGQFINELMQFGIVSKDGGASVKDDYPKAYAVFLERKANEELPKLKVRTSLQERDVSDPMNPSKLY